MPVKKSKTQNEEKLVKELKVLSKQVSHLKSLEFVKVLKRPKKLFFFAFLHGILVGFGSVIGATLGVAIFIYVLTQISFVPIVGDYVQKILDEIDVGKTTIHQENTNTEQDILTNYIKKGEDNYITPVSAVVPESPEN